MRPCQNNVVVWTDNDDDALESKILSIANDLAHSLLENKVCSGLDIFNGVVRSCPKMVDNHDRSVE